MSTLLPQVFLMRHGETLWSLSGQHSGRADIALAENGKIEAKQLAEQVKRISFQHILVSPLRRAKQTCLAAGMCTASLSILGYQHNNAAERAILLWNSRLNEKPNDLP